MTDHHFRALRAAGVGVLDSVETVGGITPASLFHELHPFGSESWTSHIEVVRAPAIIDDWITAQLATLPPSDRCFVVDTWTPAVRQHRWLCVTPPSDPGWLARLWRAEREPEAVLVLSADARRVVFVIRIFDGYLHAVTLEAAEVLAMRADRECLHHVLAATPGLLRVPTPPKPRVVLTSELLATAPGSTLPAAASDARRDRWLVDAFEGWRARRPALDDRLNAEYHGPYMFSLAGTERIASFSAYLPDPAALAAMWRHAGFGRLAVVDADYTRALLISRDDDRYEARFADLSPS